MSFTKKVYIIAALILVVIAVSLAIVQVIHHKENGTTINIISHTQRRPVCYNGKSIDYDSQFHDLNVKHLSAAKKVGLSAPIKNRKEAQKLVKQLVMLKSSSLYKIDDLDYSIPYLTPNAQQQLDSLAQDFQDILHRNDLPKYRFIITSVLRTQEDVGHLKKKNGNATSNSAHCYGTTIDITYSRFDDLAHAATYVPDENLKLVLAQALLNAKRAGNVYVKYEKNQACFHITFRK